MPSTKRQLIWPILFSTALVFVLFASVALPAGAQDNATPTPDTESDDRANRNDPAVFYADPPEITGDAEWTLGDRTFESFFPNGFEFTVEINSSAAEIETATVVWSHAPRSIERRQAEFNPETGVFLARYLGFEEETLPPWVAVNYRWQFTDVEGNSYRTEWFLGEEYYTLTDNWTRYESEDIIVFVEDGLPAELGQLSLDAMAAQRETFRTAWGALLSNKPRAILFPNNERWDEWQRTIDVGPTQGTILAGLTRSDWGGTIQRLVGSGGVVGMAYGTVLHEVAHLYQDEFASAAFPAGSWWTEGNAELFSLSNTYDIDQRVRNLAARNELGALLEGAGPNPSGADSTGFGRLGYDVGFSFWSWLVQNYGLEVHYEILQAVGGNRPRNEALEEVTGLTPFELESRWRLSVGASAVPPTLVPIPTRPAFATPTPFSFGGN